MTETRDITLGGRTFAVPRLVHRINRLAYPICRELTNAGLIDRAVRCGGALDVTTQEMDRLAELAYLACQAADPTLKPNDFDDMVIDPPELLDAFFAIRYQTGGWRPVEKGEPQPGEGEGAIEPPKSTSDA